MNADICIAQHAKDPDRPRRALDGEYLCEGHKKDLEQAIAELPAFYGDLTAPTTPGPKAYGGGEESFGLTVDLRTAALRDQIQHDLLWWCILVADDRGFTRPRSDHPSATAPYLLHNLDWLTQQRFVDELLDTMRELRARARGVVDLRPRRVPLEAPCRVHADGQPCPGTVTLWIRGDQWTADCPVCRERAKLTDERYVPQDATAYVRALARPGQTIDTAGVIRLAQQAGVPCSPEVVWQWTRRRRIVGADGEYDLPSVQAYLAKRERIAS